MDSAGVELADLDGLSVESLKALLREQHATLQEQRARLAAQDEQLGVKDAQLRSYTFESVYLNDGNSNCTPSLQGTFTSK